MAVIEYDSYKQKLLAMSDTFENLQKALDIESSKHEIARLEAEAHEDGFWNDIERSQANQMRTKQLQNKVHRFEKLVSTRDDLLALIDMGNEMDDASLLPELEEGFADLEKRIEEVRLTTLLSGEYDNCNAILTFHAGAGGQHVNKTSSAVRLIHIPTGIVTACQTQRSQFQNRDYAMQMLKSKLMELKIQQHAEKISDLKGVQLKIEWGSQIRSYVFMPYQLVKDTRTDYETGNIQAVMDGDLDGFINAYLTKAANGELKK